MPISANQYKQINPYLKYEGITVDENNPEVVLYVEFKKKTIKGTIEYVIMKDRKWKNKTNRNGI